MYVASDHGYHANDLIRLLVIGLNGHVIGQLGDTFLRKESRQQNVGIRQVQLAYANVFQLRRNLEAAALLVVEHCRKHRRRIEFWIAKEIDRTVHAYQCDRTHVADHAVILNGLEAHVSEKHSLWFSMSDARAWRVVPFESTKYHTVAATDDRPEDRGLSLVFDQILRSSSARRMTRSIAS